jgi:hypothetical protein
MVDAVPGRIFKGRAWQVLDVIATGQLDAPDVLQDMGEGAVDGRAIAIIEVGEAAPAYQIPGGATAQLAHYAPYWHH